MRYLIRIFMCLILVVATCSFAKNIPSRTFEMENGQKVIMIQIKENPVIASTIVMKVGLKHENKQINGVSHLLEHLTFNGTETRSQKQLYDDFDFLGTYNNASTGDHYTAYYILSLKENFKEALKVQEDMLFHSIIPENKIKKEKDIVLEEIKKDQNGFYFEQDRLFRETMFPDSSYGMKVIGSIDSVTGITRDDIVDFYRSYYSPGNSVCMIVGDFEFEPMEKLVREVLGKVKPYKVTEMPTENSFRSSDSLIVKSYNGRQNILNYVIEGTTCASDEFCAQEIVTSVLDKEIKKAFGHIDPRAGCSTSYTSDYGLITISISPDTADNPEKLLEDIKDFIQNSFKITKEDIENEIRLIESETMFNLERPHFFGMMVSSQIAAGRTNLFYQEESTPETIEKVINTLKNPEHSSALFLKMEATHEK